MAATQPFPLALVVFFLVSLPALIVLVLSDRLTSPQIPASAMQLSMSAIGNIVMGRIVEPDLKKLSIKTVKNREFFSYFWTFITIGVVLVVMALVGHFF